MQQRSFVPSMSLWYRFFHLMIDDLKARVSDQSLIGKRPFLIHVPFSILIFFFIQFLWIAKSSSFFLFFRSCAFVSPTVNRYYCYNRFFARQRVVRLLFKNCAFNDQRRQQEIISDLAWSPSHEDLKSFFACRQILRCSQRKRVRVLALSAVCWNPVLFHRSCRLLWATIKLITAISRIFVQLVFFFSERKLLWISRIGMKSLKIQSNSK